MLHLYFYLLYLYLYSKKGCIVVQLLKKRTWLEGWRGCYPRRFDFQWFSTFWVSAMDIPWTPTPPKFNIAPEKWCLEDEFPFGIAYLLGAMSNFRGVHLLFFQAFCSANPRQQRVFRAHFLAFCSLYETYISEGNLDNVISFSS